MCTYRTERLAVTGSGKGPDGWFPLSDASVYYDHPVHAQAEHALVIDFLAPAHGPSARVALELDRKSALALARAIVTALDEVPPGMYTREASIGSLP